MHPVIQSSYDHAQGVALNTAGVRWLERELSMVFCRKAPAVRNKENCFIPPSPPSPTSPVYRRQLTCNFPKSLSSVSRPWLESTRLTFHLFFLISWWSFLTSAEFLENSMEWRSPSSVMASSSSSIQRIVSRESSGAWWCCYQIITSVWVSTQHFISTREGLFRAQ